jgi:epoxyqueuosine reductase
LVNDALKNALRAEAAALGFARVGFASADGHGAQGARLETWLGEGRHGTMRRARASAPPPAACGPRREA